MNISKALLYVFFFTSLLGQHVSLAATADTSFTTFNNVHQGNGSGLGTRNVVDTFLFPQDISMYSQLIMRVTLSCPTGGCDPWDRFANVRVYHESEWFEIGRYITPYGRACGWPIDVSDYRSMLSDTVIIKSFIDTWTNPGWLVKIDFEFVAGTPQYNDIKVENLWYNENLVYGDANNPHVLPVITKTIDSDAMNVKLRMVNTGHGQGNTNNAAEFSPKTHSLYINGSLSNSHYLWRSNCSTNPCSPQGGTWQYNRAGWCPGADVIPADFDLTSIALPGQSATLDYRLQNYVNACSPANSSCVSGVTCTDCNYNYNGHTEPHYKISGQLISYKNSVTGILNNSVNSEFIVLPNPSNGKLTIQAKNYLDNSSVEIIDILGNLTFSTKMNSNSQLLDLSNLPKGTYFLKYNFRQKSETRRIVLQ